MKKDIVKLIKLIVKHIRKYVFPPIEFYNKSFKYYISWIFQILILFAFIFLMTRGLYLPTEYHFIETCDGIPIECYIDENFKLFYKGYEEICNSANHFYDWNITQDLNSSIPLESTG